MDFMVLIRARLTGADKGKVNVFPMIFCVKSKKEDFLSLRRCLISQVRTSVHSFNARKELQVRINLIISAYERVRTKYHAVGAFPHLFDKTKPEIDVVQVGKEYMDPL